MEYIRLEHIGKSFSGREVLRDISLSFNTGEICGIIGENGAGKSTLVHILSGQVMRDSGSMFIAGKPAGFGERAAFPEEEAIRRGIGIVHQRPLLAGELTVGENCILGTELPGERTGRSGKYRKLEEICRQWSLDIGISQPVSALTAPGRLQAALLAALYYTPRLLILDEPSAALAPDQRSAFFDRLRKAADEGLSVILLTHNLNEALNVCDRIAVLRRGRIAADLENRDRAVSAGRLRTLMFGNTGQLCPLETTETPCGGTGATPGNGEEQKRETGGPLFRVSGATVTGSRIAGLYDISFDVYSGGITVIAGHRESGLETLETVLTGTAEEAGSKREISGSVSLRGRCFPLAGGNRVTPKALRRLGTGIVPSDRTFRGSHPALSVYDILIVYRHRKLRRGFLLKRKALRDFALSLISGEGIAATPEQKTASLSGGMLQRLILAREIAELPRDAPGLFILCEPEWGLDARSSRLLWERLRETAAQG
ncbi:MAG: ATP-binding cassette domain-containing protein, partial [Spirochaetaceae bacterium]|nr:ATP-binding cassette domain-containing protein [Spirochaetaceae bacterium]